MSPQPLVDHDIHVHTFLSSCSSDPEALPERMLEVAAKCGLRTVGFANHLWDSAVPGASEWYRPQDMAHIGQIRDQIPAETRGIRVLVGCETEYVGNGRVGISAAAAAQLDFVLVPHSHFHMEGFVRPAEVNTPETVAELLRQRFAEAIELDVVTGIAHPFLPCILPNATDEIIGHISDSAFAVLFGRAAELGVSIEITTGAFPSLSAGETDGWHDSTFLHMYRLALKAGCVFHFASDTHSLDRMAGAPRLEPFAQQLGLTREHLHPLVRREA
jgi:histidinol phosphatase-like PHP family hydrolase